MISVDDALAADARRALAEWGEGRRADLPWRQTRDPWAVLVSEVMLQQTQVARVRPKYAVFLARFPDPRSCAEAPRSEVIALWSGLGYNRRAVALHRCALAIADDHGGRFPCRLDELLALPGVGPYTARAVMAFAFERDVGVLDTNVGRVLARRCGRVLGRAEAQRLADGAVPPGRGWSWNQAMLDFGALVCTKRSPSCGACPIAEGCAWRGHGDDPATGSAGVSAPQSRFEGSDREGRGRLVRALAAGPLGAETVSEVAGWPGDPERVRRVLTALVRDGLVEIDGRGVARLA